MFIFSAIITTEFDLPIGSYMYIGTKKTWVEASLICRAHGGSLVTINSFQEHYALLGYIIENYWLQVHS